MYKGSTVDTDNYSETYMVSTMLAMLTMVIGQVCSGTLKYFEYFVATAFFKRLTYSHDITIYHIILV